MLPCLYFYELIKYGMVTLSTLELYRFDHRYKTHHKHNLLKFPSHRLACEKRTHYVKVINKLPSA